MCHDREQLIGYVYEEVDARERIAIDAHLASCPDCRREVADLKGVRGDLLAWDVPNPEPIWRPLSPRAPQPIWRQVPAWLLAAAASLVFATGVAGGMATRFLWPVPVIAGGVNAAATKSVEPSAPPVATSDPTAAALAELEARVLATMRAEMSQQLRATPARTAAPPVGPGSVDALSRQVRALEQWQYEQVALNDQFDRKLRRLGSVTNTLDARMGPDAESRIVIPVSFGGVR